MRTILNNVQVKAVSSWLPINKLEMDSLSDIYGMSEVQNIIKATGVQRVDAPQDRKAPACR